MIRDNESDAAWARVGEAYNVPSEVPREEMWRTIEAQIADADASAGTDVVDLGRERERRAGRSMSSPLARRMAGWAVAAAALLVFGVGIGRVTAPESTGESIAPVADAVPTPSVTAGSDAGLTLAGREHFGRTESLLTMVRADARAGRMDPATARWAEGLLSETRLLLDAQDGGTPAVNDLLLDLELVLVQIVGVAERDTTDTERTRRELELALRSLDQGEVLPRVQAASMASEFQGI